MLRNLFILTVSFCFVPSAMADIAADIARGVKTVPATKNAMIEKTNAKDAVVQLIEADINCVDAAASVLKVYRLTGKKSEKQSDEVITAAINAIPDVLPPLCNVTPQCDAVELFALYSEEGGRRHAFRQGRVGAQCIGEVGGSKGGSPVSPN